MPRDKKNKSPINQATCADCGIKFELPFTPTSDKPVYCNNCFSKRKQSRRDQRRDHRRTRKMYEAICDKCGKETQIPFQPTPGKPIYCETCYSQERSSAPKNNIQEINRKLDVILEALVTAKIIKLPKEPKSNQTGAGNTKKITAKKPDKTKTVPKKKASAKKQTPDKKKAAPKKKAATKKK